LGETAITLDVVAFITLACALAVYSLYASAVSLRDEAAAHTTLGPSVSGLVANGGLATASFAALGFFLTPWLMRLGGYPAATIALIAITVPMIATFLGLRCWVMTRLQGATGLGEFLAINYGMGVAAVAGLTLGAAAIVFLALVLLAAASLMSIVSSGAISNATCIAIAAVLLVLTGAPAGFRTAGQLTRLHTLLASIGAIGIVLMVVAQLGGWDETAAGLTRAARQLEWATTSGRGGGDYNLALAVAGSFGPGETWNGLTILSVQIAIACTLLLMVWLPWTIATTDVRQIGSQATIGASWGGFLMIAVTIILGMGTLWIDRSGVASAPVVPIPWRNIGDIDAALLMTAVTREYVWAEVVIGLGGAAALHAIALALLGGATAALRPLWLGRLQGKQAARRAVAGSQIAASAIVIGAVSLLFMPVDTLMSLNALALSLSPVAIVPVAAACWFPTLTRQGLIAGMIAGLTVATLEIFLPLISSIAVHAAAAGIATTVIVAVLVSRGRPHDTRQVTRIKANAAFRDIFAPGANDQSQGRYPRAILVALMWIFFASGPGMVIGNDLFGAPNLPRAQWDFPIPSIAVWQFLAWATGAALIWYLARGLGMTSVTRAQLDQINAYRNPPPAARQTGPNISDH
jgi:SSS family solute:Na+ symporter